jgi:F-type H+-transporting ATPase subunit epsilon
MLSLSVISPEKKILDIECKKVTVPTKSGLITILPQHASLSSILKAGEITITKENNEIEHVIVSGGFINVDKNIISLLVDFGIHSKDLDEKIILEAKARAEKVLSEAKSESITKTALADLLHANLQLHFLLRRSKRHQKHL